jgi:protein AroM
VVTMGQSPRVDVVPEIAAALAGRAEVLEAGALDGATDAEVAALAPRPGEPALASRLRDGRGVALAKPRLLPRVQEAVDRLGPRCDAILILCTGHFPPLGSAVPVYFPDRILQGVVAGLVGPDRPLGLICPLPSQAAAAAAKWERPVRAAVASPYGADAAFQAAARDLRDADLIVLDCMGCNRHHRELVAAASGRPTLLPSAVVARVVGEVL